MTDSTPTTQVRRGGVRALVLATLAFALCFSVWGLIAPLAPLFRQVYGLSNTQVGFLVAVPVILGSLLRIPAGIVTDRWGARIVFPALLLLLVVPIAFTALSRSYGALIGAGFLLGASGASFAVGIPFVASWFPARKQGFALGIYGMGNIGTAVAALVAPRAAAGPGWPYAFWIFAPLVVAFAAIFWLVGRESPRFTPRRATLVERTRVLVDRPVAWVLVLFYFVTFGGFVAMGNFLPTFLTAAHGLTQTNAGARTAGFVVMATLARPLGGWLADRWGGRFVLNLVFAVQALFAIVLAFEPGMIGITIGFLGSAGALGIGNGAVFKLVAELFPKETGTLAGLVGAAGGLGGFFPPLVLGLVRDVTGSYAIAFMLLSEFALACLIINLLALQGHAEWSCRNRIPSRRRGSYQSAGGVAPLAPGGVMPAISSDGRGSERVPSNVITTAARDLFPGYFAMVMATGAASVAANLLGMRAVAVPLLAVNVAAFATLWSLTLIRMALFFPRIVADLKDHARGPGFFTVVAGTCVFGTQCLVVGRSPALARALWGVGIALWVLVMYSFFTAFTIRERKPTIETGINGAWLIAAVATQSVSVLGSLLAPTFGDNREVVLFFTLCMFLIGCMLYLAIITLIFYRLTFIRLTPQTMAPPYWINMGAVAITTLAGATLLLRVGEWPFLQELQPFLRGWTLFFWVTATWWIPLLFILMIWRHAYMRYPLKYDPTYWGMAFPLAMYTTGSFQLFTALGLPFMLVVPRSFIFVALAVWVGTFIGLLHSLFRAWATRSRLPAVAEAPGTGPQFPA